MQHYIDVALAFINSLYGAASTAAIVIEILLRLIPSEKPLSLLLAVSAFVHGIASVFGAAAALIDKVIPQKLK